MPWWSCPYQYIPQNVVLSASPWLAPSSCAVPVEHLKALGDKHSGTSKCHAFRPWPLNSSAGKLHQDRRTLLSSVHGARKGSQRRLTTQLLRLENGCWWKRRSTISRTAIESLRMVTSRCLDEILWSSGTTKGPRLYKGNYLQWCCWGFVSWLFFSRRSDLNNF